MFEPLIHETASRFDLPASTVSALARALLSLMANERTGGAEGFIEQFRRAGLGEDITSWFGGKDGMAIMPAQLESALGTNGMAKLTAATGLTRAAGSAAAAFLLPRMISRLTPNSVLPSSAVLLSHVSTYIAGPAGSRIEHRMEPRKERAGSARWLLWAAVSAALLALVAWLSLRGPAGTMDPQLTLSNRDGTVTYSGVVRDEATRSAIVSALGTAFGEGNITGDLRTNRSVKRAAWLPRVGDLFAALKTPGVEVSLHGDAIKLGGWLSAADRQTLTDTVRGILGSSVTIHSLRDPALEAARAANDKALSALRAIGTSGVSPDALVSVMNLAVINFATGSAEIASDSLEVIQTSAQAMKRARGGSKVEIGGHTDSTGNPSSNVTLSQARADAVKAALVNAGVPAGMLTTKGYGDTKPRATNDTEFGRFQNRRIEFTVVR